MSHGILEIKGVSKSYTADLTKSVLFDINFSCQMGDIISIIGPSGCGKSTLIKILGNVIEPSFGSVSFAGESISRLRNEYSIGWIPQFPTLLKNRNVEKNIQLPLEIIGRDNKDVSNIIKLVGLEGDEDKYPFELSGGMKQRVSFAQALSYSPKLLLLDEPFSALDEMTREKMQNELLAIARQNNPIIFFVTHSVEEAVFLADHVIIMTKKGAVAKIEKIIKGERGDVNFRNSIEFFEQVKGIRNILANS